MVLLTSGQVSVAISSFIVFLFTSALFLSGYVLQQKTVNDIREAIKPQIAPLKPDLYLPPKFRNDEFWDGIEDIVVVNSSPRGQQADKDETQKPTEEEANDQKMVGATRWQKAKKLKEKEWLKNEASAPAQKLVVEGQDTDVKKKETNSKGKSTPELEEKPLSRAERRKKIKEEILAAGEGESFKGYRRRMW